MPNLGDAHCGFGAPQSQQTLLLASFWIAASYIPYERVSEKLGGGGGVKSRTMRRETHRSRGTVYLGSGLGIDLPHGLGSHCGR